MVLADYFSRHKESNDDPYGLVPVCFCCFEIYLSHLGLDTLNVYFTRSKTKDTGEIVPGVHGVNKGLDPHVKPEHQKLKTLKPARSAPNVAQNIAKNLMSESINTLCRPATRMGDRGASPEGPKPWPVETDINMPRQTPHCVGTSPGKSLIHPKGKHQPNLIFRELLESIQVGKHQKVQLDTSIDTGNDEKILEPKIHIFTDADFVIPPSLDKVVDPT